jgi:Zn ribbon nucleic-acid-binding protein
VFSSLIPSCDHMDQIQNVQPSAQGCEECLTCGHVGCCDQSLSPRSRNGLTFRVAFYPGGSLVYILVA